VNDIETLPQNRSDLSRLEDGVTRLMGGKQGHNAKWVSEVMHNNVAVVVIFGCWVASRQHSIRVLGVNDVDGMPSPR
jgi:hypothetical protein